MVSRVYILIMMITTVCRCWLRSSSKKHYVRKFSLNAYGFSKTLGGGYNLDTQVICGSNSIEHGINLIEEYTDNVVVLGGWNMAKLDSLMWELEPRGFHVTAFSVKCPINYSQILDMVSLISDIKPGAIIAMGNDHVISIAKIVTTILNKGQESIPFLSERILSTNHSFNERLEQQVKLIAVPMVSDPITAISPSASIDPILTLGQSVKTNTNLIFPIYLNVPAPAVALFQGQVFDMATMSDLNYAIVCMIGLAAEEALSSSEFLPEILSWRALQILMPLLDVSVKTARDRLAVRAANETAFYDHTVHDDETLHTSQYFRRYGHGFDHIQLEALCEATVLLSSATVNSKPSPLRVLAAVIRDSNRSLKVVEDVSFIELLAHITPRYLMELSNWTAGSSPAALSACGATVRCRSNVYENSDKEGDKAFVRTKIARLTSVLSTSIELASLTQILSPQLTVLASDDSMALEVFMTALQELLFTQLPGPVDPSYIRNMSVYRLAELQRRDCYAVRNYIQSICGSSAYASSFSIDSIYRLLNEYAIQSPLERHNNESEIIIGDSNYDL